MSQKRHTADQIIAKLRRADVELGGGLLGNRPMATGIAGYCQVD